MKLWLISQEENNKYDTYDSAVVAAETDEAARRTVPGSDFGDYDWTSTGMLLVKSWGGGIREMRPVGPYSPWATELKSVECKYLGEAVEGTEAGVICASFNAG
jgi:hypothetical protein